MSYLLFLDESGIDHRSSPYEVLAGVAVSDRELWPLICAVQDIEREMFGGRISLGPDEIKARGLLKRKTFRLASQLEPLEPTRRAELARQMLRLRQRSVRSIDGQSGRDVWSFTLIDDLRPGSERRGAS